MNKYEKFNDMKVDLNEFNITPEDRDNFKVDDIEKKKILNKIKGKKKNYKKVIVGIAAAFVIMVSFSFTNPGQEVLAKTKEFILETFNFKQEEAFDNTMDLDEFSYHTDKMVYGEDYKFKISSVMVYGNELNITALIEFDKEQSEDFYIQGLWLSGLKIGDKDIDITKKGGGGGPLEENPKTKYEVFEFIISDEEVKLLEESKEITLTGEGLVLKQNGVPEIHGEKFEIVLNEVDLENIASKSEKTDLDIKLKDKKHNVNYTITGYEFNPYKTKIYVKSDYDIKNRDKDSYDVNSQEFSLNGKLDNGKRVSFYGYYTVDENYQPTNNMVFEIDMNKFQFMNGIKSLKELRNAKEMTLNFNIVENELLDNLSEKEIDESLKMLIEKNGDEYALALEIEDMPIKERNKKLFEILKEDLNKSKNEEYSDIIIRDEDIGKPFTIKLK